VSINRISPFVQLFVGHNTSKSFTLLLIVLSKLCAAKPPASANAAVNIIAARFVPILSTLIL